MGVALETMVWRATGTTILRGVDDIQQILDDQIVKTQSMRASPYIGPFEERVRLWEGRLDLTQVRPGSGAAVGLVRACHVKWTLFHGGERLATALRPVTCSHWRIQDCIRAQEGGHMPGAASELCWCLRDKRNNA